MPYPFFIRIRTAAGDIEKRGKVTVESPAGDLYNLTVLRQLDEQLSRPFLIGGSVRFWVQEGTICEVVQAIWNQVTSDAPVTETQIPGYLKQVTEQLAKVGVYVTFE